MRKPSRSDNAVIQYFNIEMGIEPNPNWTEPNYQVKQTEQKSNSS